METLIYIIITATVSIVIPFTIWVARSIIMLKEQLNKKLDVSSVQNLIDLNQRKQDTEIRIIFKELQEIKEMVRNINVNVSKEK